MTGNLAILWPMIVQAFLTLGVYGVLAMRRKALVGDKAALAAWRSTGIEPEPSNAAAKSVANQFELPVLFYVVCLGLYIVNGASWLAVIVAWIFAASRFAHAVIHLGSNRIRQRMPAWLVGYLAVLVLWLIFAIHILGVAAL
ncbi:hypothetical protein ASG43_14500 [Aureimonas sp. Leaf454]|uniref:MAPEG family protein n=1 Tax=Aureimonas sp. Leaf454 TaxID=1736381 RepID=UPI0006FEA4B5|nr:MAPEG family protein [Aureimonas sp. Leaf454]KQT44538.1 hypothetical protein ASG43_14500 [Aureimonas sp. Leaf454]